MRWKFVSATAVWLVFAYVCARIDPGALQLYITLTVFVLILRNLGTRRDGPSAYSVFNAGCKPLLGQIQADQFENEMRHRPLEEPSQDSHIGGASSATSPVTRINNRAGTRDTNHRRFAPRNDNAPATQEELDDILARTRAEILRGGRRGRASASTFETASGASTAVRRAARRHR